ncbi:MAG: RNase J family beta-CASP ribonuclease, partial [Lactobacillus amylovorus]|nr:RNase J family beta-CASP ribonuclease [Lactobacillus amylovorus]
KAINNNFEHKKFDWTELKQDIRGDLEKFLYKRTNRRPVILPVVMEVNQNRHRAMQKRNEKTQNDNKTNNAAKKSNSKRQTNNKKKENTKSKEK